MHRQADELKGVRTTSCLRAEVLTVEPPRRYMAHPLTPGIERGSSWPTRTCVSRASFQEEKGMKLWPPSLISAGRRRPPAVARGSRAHTEATHALELSREHGRPIEERAAAIVETGSVAQR